MNKFKVRDTVRVANVWHAEIFGIVMSSNYDVYKVRFLNNVDGCEEDWLSENRLTPVQKDDYIKYINFERRLKINELRIR